MKAALTAIALILSATFANAQQCVSVDTVIEKATETKREYGYLEKGNMLTALNAIYVDKSGVPIEADRGMVIDVSNGLIIAFQIGASFCGFLIVSDDDIANSIRLAVFGTKI